MNWLFHDSLMGCVWSERSDYSEDELLQRKQRCLGPDVPPNHKWPASIPCPPSKPLLHNLLSLAEPNTGTYFQRFSEENDTSVIAMQIGSYPALVVCGVDAVHDVLVGDAFQGRMRNQEGPPLWLETSVTNASGSFGTLLRSLVNHGFKRYKEERTYENTINSSVDTLIPWLRAQAEKGPFRPKEFIVYFAVFDLITKVVLGSHLNPNSKDAKKLVDAITGRFHLFGEDVQDYVRCLRTFMSTDAAAFRRFRSDYDSVIKPLFDARMKNRADDSENKDGDKDVLDYMLEFREAESEKFEMVDDDMLFGLACVDMHAGSVVFGSLIDFCLVFLVNNPEIVGKIAAEVEHVCPEKDQHPRYKDLENLQYTNAFCKEALRIRTTAVFSFSDRVTEKTTLKNHRPKAGVTEEINVPENCMMLVDIWGVHHNKNLWPEPETFRPERFLEAKGDEEAKCPVDMSKRFIPFGARDGPRTCVTPQLVLQYLPILIANLVQNFTFRSEDGKPLSDEPTPGAPIYTNYQQQIVLETKTDDDILEDNSETTPLLQ